MFRETKVLFRMIIQFPAKLLKNKNKGASPHDYPIFHQTVERTKVLLRIAFQFAAEMFDKKSASPHNHPIFRRTVEKEVE